VAIELRPYQREAREAVRAAWREGYRKVLISLATGTGKTWIFVFIIWDARANGMRSLVLVNTDELVDQTVAKLRKVGVNPGIVKGPRNEWNRDVVVASIQTLCRFSRMHEIPPSFFELIIVDECHYANAGSYQRVLWYFGAGWHLGVTATPFRGDKKSLAVAGWDTVAYVYSTDTAVEQGWLCPFRFQRVDTNVNLDAVKQVRSPHLSIADFDPRSLQTTINTPERNEKIVNAALEHLVIRSGTSRPKMRKLIAFCCNIEHTVDLANSFRRKGIEAWAVYGTMKDRYRQEVLNAHKRGAYPVLTACNMLTHGYDDPSIEAIVMARPTKSKVLYLQEIGRGFRPSPGTGKTDCIVLDVVDVSNKHKLTIGKELLDLKDELGEKGKPAAVVVSERSEEPANDIGLGGAVVPEAEKG
jgi:superfamily II DNA or RNA helicase